MQIECFRDGRGVAWAKADCGCYIRLLEDASALVAFTQHVLDRTPCQHPCTGPLQGARSDECLCEGCLANKAAR